ncbi:MAG: hypothetical protein NTW56_04695 [Alphaproteobacteria bacterium]|nr:hypothetical protein [Alphaproteobacteria bacterium]
MPEPKPRWSALVCARNEQRRIGACLHALAQAAAQNHLHVTVLLNGSTDDTAREAMRSLRDSVQPVHPSLAPRRQHLFLR